jgi:hypothetical protein
LLRAIMSTFSSLLDQAGSAAAGSAAPETLADTLRKHAKQLTDEDLEVLVAGLREQRERWNAAQQRGSRERITAKKVGVSRAKKPTVPTIPAGLLATKRKPVL